MDSSESLKLDENLARFLAAYDQGLEGADPSAPSLYVPFPQAVGNEHPVTPLHPNTSNEGSLGELLPDPERAARTRPPAPPVPSGPHRIGRFELRRQLGKGGCGIVFLAYDPKLRREVALKVPRPEMLMNPDAKRRLKLEALAASEFDHPNLVPVYEWGEVGPLCFIATAYCPGQTLAAWLDRQAFPVPVRQAARLVATLADAVQHAHDRGVLHRDLKPNNVILQEMKVEENDEPSGGSVQMRGAHYVPRIVDFGLAKLAERGGPSETGTRQILGTPKYMAPEQAQARREDIGPPADVYALGVLLYELVTGRAPYDGASDVEVLRQSVEGKPIQPRHLRPDIPRDLEAICLKAMALTTAERYRTAIDFADDLRRFLDKRPTIARPLAWSGRAVRWLRRNDQLVAIAVLAVIALSVTLLGTWNGYRTSSRLAQSQTALGTVVRDQEGRNRADRQREYAGYTREAFLAWRGGNTEAAADALEFARRTSATLKEPPDFAHDYLARLVKERRLMIVCPAGPVTALAVSPDGARLASGHADGTLAVWDRATGKQLGSVEAHAGEVSHVAFALGGKLVFTLGRAELLGWSAGDGLVAAPEPHRTLGTNITCLVAAPDGSAVFAGDGAGGVHRFDLTGAKQNRTVVAVKGDRVTAVACAADTAGVLVGTKGGKVVSYSSALGDEYRVEDRPRGVTALAARPHGGYSIGFADGHGQRSGAGAIPRRQEWNDGTHVDWIASSPRGVVSNGAPGWVRFDYWGSVGKGAPPVETLFNSSPGELATGDIGAVRAGAFSLDGKTLFTAGTDGVIRSWSGPAESAKWVYPSGEPFLVAVHPTGGDFVVHGRYDCLRANTLKPTPGGAFAAVRIHADGTHRAVAFDGRAAVVYAGKGAAEERLRVKPADDRTPTAAALTPDGARLAVGDDAGRVGVWAVADGKSLGTIDTGLRRPVRDVILTEGGRYVAARTATGVGVWLVATAELLGTIPADEQAAFRFLPEGDRIAVAGRDGVVRVWTVSGREQMSLFGHVGRVTALGASLDGRTLVSGCATGEVKFWDLRTGQELFGQRRHSVAVTVIEFAADGKLLVTGGDGQVAVWDARSE